MRDTNPSPYFYFLMYSTMQYSWIDDPDNSYDIWRDEQAEKESEDLSFEDREQIQRENDFEDDDMEGE